MNKKTQEPAPESTQQTQEQHNTADASTAEVKKKAGRPAKAKTAEIAVGSEPVAIFGRKKRPVKASSTAGTAKKAGRPAKVKVEATAKSAATAEKKRPGRPKVEKPVVAGAATAEKKRPGRPKLEKPAAENKKSAGRKKHGGKSESQDNAAKQVQQRPEAFPVYYHLEKKISRMEKKLKKALKKLDRLKKTFQG